MTLDDIREAIANRDRHRRLGSVGYGLPDLEDVEVIPMTPTGSSVRGVTVVGPPVGSGGHLAVHRRSNFRAPLRITCHPAARNALVVVGPECSLHGTIDLYAEDQTVLLAGEASPSHHGGQFAARLWSKGTLLFVGKGSTTNGSHYVVSGEGRAIIIGEDCMFAGDVTLRTDDMHALIDLETGQKLNDAADVVLEPHVWLGQGVLVLKGTSIGLGSVVGARSLVVKGCSRFSVLGGVPAKVLSTGRSWDRHQTPSPDRLEALRRLDRHVAPFPPVDAPRPADVRADRRSS